MTMLNKKFTIYQFNTKSRVWVEYPPVEAMTRPGALKETRQTYGLSFGTCIISETGTVEAEKNLSFMQESGMTIQKFIPEKQAL